MKQLKRVILKTTKDQSMKPSNTPANIGAMKQITRDILQDTNSQCMKESSFHANIAAMKHSKCSYQRPP